MGGRITALLAALLVIAMPTHAPLGATAWDIHPTPLTRMNEAGVGLSVPSLVYVLENSSDQELRYWSALALAQLEDRKAIPHLISATGDANKFARLGAAVALGHFRAPESTQALRTLAAEDPEYATRKAAVISLGKIRNADAALGLIQTANNEQEPDDIRYQAIATLGEFADRAAMTKLLPLARSTNPNLRAAARLSMSKRGVPVEIKDLIVSTTDSEVNVVTALGLVQHLEEMSGQRFLNADDVDEVEAARRRVSLWWTESTGAQDVNQGPRARLRPALE